MTDRTEARLRALLETAAQNSGHNPSDITGKLGAFYKAFMDEESVEALGAKPVTPIMAAIQAMSTREALGAMMGRANFDFAGSFFEAAVDVDAKNPSQYAVHLRQGGSVCRIALTTLKPTRTSAKRGWCINPTSNVC